MRLFLLLILVSVSSISYSQEVNKEGPNITDIDGNIYKTVFIGKYQWMAENLKVSKYNDGTLIPQVIDNLDWKNLNKGAWCYYENDESNNVKYGKLYNWYVTMQSKNICPSGWRVPSNEDWGLIDSNYVNNLIKTDIGYRDNYSASFEVLGYKGTSFWSSSLIDGIVYSQGFYFPNELNNELFFWPPWNEHDKKSGLSIRCMRDTTSSKNSKSNKESISIEKINKCYSLALLKSFVNATNLDEFKYQYVKKIEYLKRREELRVKAPKLFNKLNERLISQLIGDGNSDKTSDSFEENGQCEQYLDAVIEKIRFPKSGILEYNFLDCFPSDNYSVESVQGEIISILQDLSGHLSGATYSHYFLNKNNLTEVNLNDKILFYAKKKYPKIDWNNNFLIEKLFEIKHLKANNYKVSVEIGLGNHGDYTLYIPFSLVDGKVIYNYNSLIILKN